MGALDTDCTGCFRPECRCLRMLAEPIPHPSWFCRTCWNPRDELEENHYRQQWAIPEQTGLQCMFCGRLPPLESIVAAWANTPPRAAGKSEPAKEAPRKSAKDATENVPDRLAHSIAESARLLGISVTKVKDEIRDGKITVVKVGKRRRVLKAELQRYLLRKK